MGRRKAYAQGDDLVQVNAHFRAITDAEPLQWLIDYREAIEKRRAEDHQSLEVSWRDVLVEMIAQISGTPVRTPERQDLIETISRRVINAFREEIKTISINGGTLANVTERLDEMEDDDWLESIDSGGING